MISSATNTSGEAMQDIEMQEKKRRSPPPSPKGDDANTLEPTLPLKLGCEFVGTFGLAYTVVQKSLNLWMGDVGTPVSAAAYLVLMVYGIGSVSGCHINPGVSTAVFFWGAISKTMPNWMIEYPLYVLSQVAGALLGAYIAARMNMTSNLHGDEIGALLIFPYRQESEKWGIAMVGEAFAIFFFTFAILRVCCDHDKPPQATDGIVIGAALLAAILGTEALSGGVVNPALATGLRIANYALDDEYDIGVWGASKEHGEETFFCVYWLGPIFGALLAAGFHFVIEFQTSITFGGYTFLHSREGRDK